MSKLNLLIFSLLSKLVSLRAKRSNLIVERLLRRFAPRNDTLKISQNCFLADNDGYNLDASVIFWLIVFSWFTVFSGNGVAGDVSSVPVLVEKAKFKEAVNLLKQAIRKNPKDSGYYLSVAQVYEKQNKFEEALKWLNEGLKQLPDNAKIYSGLANAYYNMAKYDEAIKYLDKGIKADAREIELYIVFGRVYYRMGRYDEAIKQLNEGLKIKPDDVRLYSGLASAYFRKTKYDEALKWLNDGLKLDPKDSQLYVWFGYIYREMGRLEEAAKYLLEGSKINPKDSEILRALGKVYRNMGRYEDSIMCFKKVIELKAEGGFQGLARTYSEMGREKEAIELYNKELKKGYYYACPYQGLGNVYKKTGNPAQAEENLKAVIVIEPYRWKGYYELAQYYYEVGKLDKAMEFIEKALALSDGTLNKPKVMQLKGFILIMAGQYDPALKIFNDAINESGPSCSALAGLGHVYNGRKDFSRARDYFTEALKLCADKKDSSRITALLGLGWVNANLHNDIEAIKYYSRILEEEPLNMLALLGMGNAYNWLEDYDNAQIYFNKVLEIDKDNEYALAELGTVYLNRGNDTRARELLTDSLKINNATYSCPYEGLGLLYMKSGKVKLAEDNFKKAIEINPDVEYRKYNGLAEIYIKQAKFKEARELLNKAIENYPDNSKARELLREIEGK